MARGGARNRSGPSPDPSSGRSDARGYSLTALPSEGYSGPVPPFPLPVPAARELELWAEAWASPQAIRRIELSFDTDFDHPLEHVLMGHPERVIPFCVKAFHICADGREVASVTDNHQTRRIVNLPAPLTTSSQGEGAPDHRVGPPAGGSLHHAGAI